MNVRPILAVASRRLAEAMLLLVAIALLIPAIGSNDPTEYVIRLSSLVMGGLAFFASRLVAHGPRIPSLVVAVVETAAFSAIGYALRLVILVIAGVD